MISPKLDTSEALVNVEEKFSKAINNEWLLMSDLNFAKDLMRWIDIE